ncbi:MAG: hypothetical protein GX297_01130 [Treponema sp.]|jgi:hypothetical protein|nr:hypothetical protein [Treponema sp.]
MKQKKIFFAVFCCFLLLASCKKITGKVTAVNENSEMQLKVEESTETYINDIIVLLFAYDYNSPEFIDDCLEYLQQEYGLEENGGIIRPIVFPDDFQKGGRTRISILRDFVRGADVNAVITFGAPEDTAATLTVLREQGWKTPVYTLFPQDELLPSEYVSDFVLENVDLQRQIDAESLFFLTSRLIRYTQTAEELNVATMKNVLQNIVGFDWQVLPYTDTETGIRPANHFVLQSTSTIRFGTIK